MQENPHRTLERLKPEKEFFIGIDSDGCVFDTMEIKQKVCFFPNTVKFWNLEAVSDYVLETIEFVSLYSTGRGLNRFQALVREMNLLRERPEVIAAGVQIPDMLPLTVWMEKENWLGNPSLQRYADEVKDPLITNVLNWSLAVNADIEKKVHSIKPYPLVRESLQRIQDQADAIVVSQTPVEALEREWREHKIEQYARLIAGQEHGTKFEHLKFAAKGKYPDGKILMLGDASGDRDAAKQNGILFYPIHPGHEEASWERFYHEALDRFFEGNYAGEYEDELIEEFNSYLPETPPWKS